MLGVEEELRVAEGHGQVGEELTGPWGEGGCRGLGRIRSARRARVRSVPRQAGRECLVVEPLVAPGERQYRLAVRLGWYDQAHFINDFRSMLGSTPGEYADAHGS